MKNGQRSPAANACAHIEEFAKIACKKDVGYFAITLSKGGITNEINFTSNLPAGQIATLLREVADHIEEDIKQAIASAKKN